MTPPPPPRLRPVRLSPTIIAMAEVPPHHSICEFMAPFLRARCYLLFAHGQRSFTRPPYSTPFATVTGSPFSQRYSYCYSSRLPSSFARSSCAGASDGALKRPSSRASLHLIIRVAQVAVVLSARSQSCGRSGWPLHPMLHGTLSSYVYVSVFSFPSFPSHHPHPTVSFERNFSFLTSDVYAARWRIVAEVGSLAFYMALIRLFFFSSPCLHSSLVCPAGTQSRAQMRLRMQMRVVGARGERRPPPPHPRHRSHFPHIATRRFLPADACGCAARFRDDSKGARHP